jgi:hypothetical protein
MDLGDVFILPALREIIERDKAQKIPFKTDGSTSATSQ